MTDCGRNMLVTFRSLNVESLTCFAHKLQIAILAVQNSGTNFKNLLKHARSIVSHYKHSSKTIERLYQLRT